MKRVLLIGGGSGGHVFPLTAVAKVLKSKSQNLELQLWGDGDFAKLAAQKAEIKYKPIIASKFRRYFSFLNIIDLFKLIPGFFQSMWMMYWYMPDAVFAKGYASLMPAIAAKFYMIPFYIHESDSTPGLANKILSKIANKIFISFESSAKYFDPSKTELVGNPVVTELAQGSRDEALNIFQLNPGKKTILILGGSQGAKKINDLILESLVQLTQNYQIIHSTGESQFKKVKEEVEKYQKEGESSYGHQITDNYRVYPFLSLEEMKNAYAAADVIIARGGAGLIFEIAMIGKPVIIIPLSLGTSRGDQILNAKEFSMYGAMVLEEENLAPHILFNQIEELLRPDNYIAISEKMKLFAKPDAADKIASVLL